MQPLKHGCSEKTAHSAEVHSAAVPPALSASMIEALVKMQGMRWTD
jgi:hypothetical protein